MRLMLAFALACLLCRSVQAQGWVCAEGGGTGSGAWAAEMYGWMVEKGGGGHVVLLGAVELDEQPDPREAAFIRAGAKSAQSLVITAANADTQETFDAINAASIVFIRGGSQSRYVEWWKGTKTEAAIRAVFARGGVVGGTSAGCAILGEVTYDALHGSLRPEEVIKDARHPDLTLTRGFLGLVPGVLFDTHFGERARLPRLAVMLAHCREDLKVEPLGIGLDARTALCIGPDGIAEVKGEGRAVLLALSPATTAAIAKDAPPTIESMPALTLPAGTKLDLRRRAVLKDAGPKPAPPFAACIEPVKLNGGDGDKEGDRRKAKWTTLCEQPRVLAATDAYSSAQRTMQRAEKELLHKGSAVVLLAAAGINLRAEGSVIHVLARDDTPPSALLVIDGLRPGPAQPDWVIGEEIVPLRLHLLAPGRGFDLISGTPLLQSRGE
jgi:cyanophycinase